MRNAVEPIAREILDCVSSTTWLIEDRDDPEEVVELDEERSEVVAVEELTVERRDLVAIGIFVVV